MDMQLAKSVGAVVIISGTVILSYQMVASHGRSQEPDIAQHLVVTNAVTQHDAVLESKPSLAELSSKRNVIDNETASVESAIDQPSANYPWLPAYDIGNSSISDEDFLALLHRLNNDPILMADLINELRSESDPKRLQRLISIVGSTQNALVLPAAQEMIYSGMDSTRKAGLDLLSRIAPKNPEAYLVASELLISESEPAILIAALNIFAQPATTSQEVRGELVAQVLTLTEHDSASVRGYSLSILAKLSKEAELSSVFNNGLDDPASSVRSSAASALSNFPYHSEQTSQKLLALVESEVEPIRVRRGAFHALVNNPPDGLTKAQLEELELSMRRSARQ